MKIDQSLERSLDYQFKDKRLLELALSHRSVGNKNNERLEYLGDALLGFIIAEKLYEKFPDAPEGKLTRLRASLVKRDTLAKLARHHHLGDYIRLGQGEKKSGGWRRASILSNTLEAIIGAIYLDSDFLTCRQSVLSLYSELLDTISPDKVSKDAKTELQEYLQARKLPIPTYKVIAEQGLAHAREFTVECKVEILAEPIVAVGRSKRGAEQGAAQKTLELLQETQG